jgi:hypothetical protein
MAASIATCREQEALQRARAISEPLENCRKVALSAAKAWAAEAVLAEKRAAKATPLDKADAAIAAEFARDAAEDIHDQLPLGP